MLTGPSLTPRTHILARIAAGSGTHDVAMMKASPKKTMAAYVADGEVERRAPPPRPTTATGGSRGGLGAFAHRPGSAPSSAAASHRGHVRFVSEMTPYSSQHAMAPFTMARIDRCECMTPLGTPVLPLVYMTSARSSGAESTVRTSTATDYIATVSALALSVT